MAIQSKIFDAVSESRKWREATSRKLDAMSRAERIAYLKEASERIRSELRARHPVVVSAR